MARIAYFAIQEEIQRVLQADATLADVLVTVEEDGPKSGEQMPWIGVYLEDREDAGESIAAGTRQVFNVRYGIWIYEYHPESVKQAAQLRDVLIGKVEIALMKNRTLNQNVEGVKILRGEFESAKDRAGFIMGGSIVVEILKTASTL